MVKVFIDGSAGTTGLIIRERLASRDDIQLIELPFDLRKDVDRRKDAINSADIVFLCLPDDAAREAVSLVEDSRVRVIDTSTAHRTAEGWTYGFPEIVGDVNIATSTRIANPGCHASGFIALVAPLKRAGVISGEDDLDCFSLTGYTGGGKKMIAEYESEDRPVLYHAPRTYGLPQTHKHLAEMQKICGLRHAPCFVPVVADYPRGMEVIVPLSFERMAGSITDVCEIYADYYKGNIVRFSNANEDGFLSASFMANKDSMIVSAYGSDDRMTLVARFDNLGKGASGAAIQNMNILLGLPQEYGLNI